MTTYFSSPENAKTWCEVSWHSKHWTSLPGISPLSWLALQKRWSMVSFMGYQASVAIYNLYSKAFAFLLLLSALRYHKETAGVCVSTWRWWDLGMIFFSWVRGKPKSAPKWGRGCTLERVWKEQEFSWHHKWKYQCWGSPGRQRLFPRVVWNSCSEDGALEVLPLWDTCELILDFHPSTAQFPGAGGTNPSGELCAGWSCALLCSSSSCSSADASEWLGGWSHGKFPVSECRVRAAAGASSAEPFPGWMSPALPSGQGWIFVQTWLVPDTHLVQGLSQGVCSLYFRERVWAKPWKNQRCFDFNGTDDLVSI